MLILLGRLALRAGEVAALVLDDVDWRRGELAVSGKGGRRDRLPLPVDVGEALATYVHDGRCVVSCRALFWRVHAPIGGLSSSAVSAIVAGAGKRAGVTASARQAPSQRRDRHAA